MYKNRLRKRNKKILFEYFSNISTGDVELLATYWSEKIIFEAVFSYTGSPSVTAGKDEVYKRLKKSYGLVSMSFNITEVHEFNDPNKFIVEYYSDGNMLGTGEKYSNLYITIVEFESSKIKRFKEFYDSEKCAEAFQSLI